MRVLVNDKHNAGRHEVEFSAEGARQPSVGLGSASGGDGAKLPSGVYFYRLQADKFIETKKLMLLR